MARASLILGLACALLLVGCSGQQELAPEQKKTLTQNLNSPVDVEKVRAEYKAQQGGKTGAPTESQ